MPFDPTSWPSGGGSAAPITRELLSGVGTSVANGAFGLLTWDSHDAGDVLLSRSSLTAPTIITSGVYAVSVIVQVIEDLTVGGWYNGRLEVDASGLDPSESMDSPPASAVLTQPVLSLGLTFYIPAGHTLKVGVANNDGSAARLFQLLGATIQRLS